MSLKRSISRPFSRIFGSATAAADNYGEIEFALQHRYNVYIHQIQIHINWTTMANIAANDKAFFQISKINLAAISDYNNNVVWKHLLFFPKAIANMAGNQAEATLFFEFKYPILLKQTDAYYLGFNLPEAAVVSVNMLVKEIDVSEGI